MDPREVPTDPTGWFYKILGLLVTAIFVSLGAPFWFDMLNQWGNLRSAGKAPDKVTDAPAKKDEYKPPASEVVKPKSPTPPSGPTAESELHNLADDAVRYVEDLRSSGYIRLRADDVAISYLMTAVAERRLEVTETQIDEAIRAAFDRRRSG